MAEAANPRQQQHGGTASAEEVARFTAIADGWWDPAGKFRPLHQINPPRITFIRDHIVAHNGRDPLVARPLHDLSLLDIGCGGGLLCEPMARLGARVSGIDAGERNIEIAAAHAAQEGLDIDYRHVLPEDMAGRDETFDVVLNMEVIEHVADVAAFMAASAALLKPGGVMVLSTLNRTLKSLALAKIGAEYILRWLPRGTHDWRKFVRPSEMAAALRPHGLDISTLRGLVYDPFTDSWALSRDLDVNYLAFAVKR